MTRAEADDRQPMSESRRPPESEAALRSSAGQEAKKVLLSEIGTLSALLKGHDVLITCTGKDHFLSTTPWTDEIRRSQARLINMGAADEFGPETLLDSGTEFRLASSVPTVFVSDGRGAILKKKEGLPEIPPPSGADDLHRVEAVAFGLP